MDSILLIFLFSFWCPVLSIRNRTLGVYNGDSFVAYIRPSLSPTCDPSQRIKLVEIHHRRLRCTYTEMCKWTRSCCTSQRKETLNDFQLHEVCSFKSKCDFPKHLNRMPVTLKHQVWVLSVQYECTGHGNITILCGVTSEPGITNPESSKPAPTCTSCTSLPESSRSNQTLVVAVTVSMAVVTCITIGAVSVCVFRRKRRQSSGNTKETRRHTNPSYESSTSSCKAIVDNTDNQGAAEEYIYKCGAGQEYDYANGIAVKSQDFSISDQSKHQNYYTAEQREEAVFIAKLYETDNNKYDTIELNSYDRIEGLSTTGVIDYAHCASADRRPREPDRTDYNYLKYTQASLCNVSKLKQDCEDTMPYSCNEYDKLGQRTSSSDIPQDNYAHLRYDRNRPKERPKNEFDNQERTFDNSSHTIYEDEDTMDHQYFVLEPSDHTLNA